MEGVTYSYIIDIFGVEPIIYVQSGWNERNIIIKDDSTIEIPLIEPGRFSVKPVWVIRSGAQFGV